MKKISLLIIIAFLIITGACKSSQTVEKKIGFLKNRAEDTLRQVDLFVFAVGINEYSNNLFPDLKYAANDAKNICNIFKAQEGKFFRKVNTILISDNADIKPTTENILSNLLFFDEVRPNDTVIFFAASHRIIIDGEFYLMTSDSQYNDNEGFVLESFININDVLSALDMPAYKIFIIDTNASEIANGGDFTVLRACKEDQKAIENNFYNGGLLTTSILEAFEKAETKNDVITLNDLLNYVVLRVEEMSNNQQTPLYNLASEAGDLIMGSKVNLKNIGINIP